MISGAFGASLPGKDHMFCLLELQAVRMRGSEHTPQVRAGHCNGLSSLIEAGLTHWTTRQTQGLVDDYSS